MLRNEDAGARAAAGAGVRDVEMKVEVIVIPVADADRAKQFYTGLGWRLDADFAFDNGFRVVQFTPPGSACSVQFGTHITSAAPARPRACTWSYPTSRRRGASSRPAAPP